MRHDEALAHERDHVHGEVDLREQRGADRPITDGIVDQVCLLEVQDSRGERHEEDEEGDSRQVGRAEYDFDSAPHAARHGSIPTPQRAPGLVRVTLQLPSRLGRHLQRDARDEQKRECRQHVDQAGGHGRADDCSQRTADRNRAEQPLTLFAREQVGHEPPEHGDHEQGEHAGPHVERSIDPGAGSEGERSESGVERDQIRDEEPVHPRNECPARPAGDDPGVRGHRDEHDDEHRSPQDLKVAPVRGADLVPDGPQDVVGQEDAEAVNEGPYQRPCFLFSHLGQAFE